MRLLAILSASLTLSFCSPVSAAPQEAATQKRPALVGQTRSWADLLAICRGTVKTTFGTKITALFDKEVYPLLVPSILPAVDADKPIGLYSLAQAQPQDCRFVLIVPLRTRNDLVKQLENLGIKIEKTPDEAIFKIITEEIPVHLKLLEDYAYLSLGGSDALADQKLVDPKDVFDPKEKSLIALKLHIDRIQESLTKIVEANVFDAIEQIRNIDDEKEFGDVIKPTKSFLSRLHRQLLNECESITLRLDADPKIGDLKVDLAIKPKPNTAAAKAIAARQGNTNAFGGLVTSDAVQWLMCSAPLFDEDLREALVNLSVRMHKITVERKQNPYSPESRAFFDAFYKSLTTNLKKGSMDFAAVIRGPNGNGHFTGVAAFELFEAAEYEKSVKESIKHAPEDTRKLVKLDVSKLDGMNIHEIRIPNADRLLKKCFGPNLTLRIGVHQNAIYMTLGPDSMKILGEVSALKPTRTPGFDNSGNLAATARFVRYLIKNNFDDDSDIDAMMHYGTLVGMEKMDRRSGIQLSLTGGEQLHITLKYNLSFGTTASPISLLGSFTEGTRTLSGPKSLEAKD